MKTNSKEIVTGVNKYGLFVPRVPSEIVMVERF